MRLLAALLVLGVPGWAAGQPLPNIVAPGRGSPDVGSTGIAVIPMPTTQPGQLPGIIVPPRADGPVMHGLGRTPHRVTVDSSRPPWSAVARIVMPGGGCTGTLINPTTMVTAAHCLFNRATNEPWPASSINVLLGYDNGHWAARGVPSSFRTAKSYDPKIQNLTQNSDVGLLRFGTPLGTAIVPVAESDAAAGRDLIIGGYGQDLSEAVLADVNCQVQRVLPGRDGEPVMMHNCAATHGTSGGPVFARAADGSWRLMGLNVTARGTQLGGGAVPASAIRALMER